MLKRELEMLIEVELPAWAQTCLKQGRNKNSLEAKCIDYEELSDGTIKINNCSNAGSECFGCNPRGAKLPINPQKLKEIERFSSQDFSEEECPTMEHTVELPNGKEHTELRMPVPFIVGKFRKYCDSS